MINTMEESGGPQLDRIKLVEPVSMVVELGSHALAIPMMHAGLHIDMQPGMVLRLVSVQPVFEGKWQVIVPITIDPFNAETIHIACPLLMDCAYPLDPQGQMVIGCHCEGCEWWNDWGLGDIATHCEDGSTPEPWYSAAMGGGTPGCPNYSPQVIPDAGVDNAV